ncbi:MAG TPA: V-type ATPase 116kDa subunit family protein, partial [Acidimicrobiales bacterium]|nr:V-type ATPase 116kDa subunit family protein [Acidimicrobiales bacterium]
GPARPAIASLLLAPPAERGEARRSLVVLGPERERVVLDAVLLALGFEEEALPRGRKGTLEELAAATDREAEGVAAESVRLEEEVREFSAEMVPTLASTEARVLRECRLEEARRCFPRTETAVLLQGWIPEVNAPAVEKCLQEATGRRCALELNRPGTEEEEQVPVLLRPSPLLRPFERLVAGFGLPRYLELSPTPFLAVSYLLMFGMMFGDVGHGGVLALAGLVGLWLGKWRDASVLLLLCGLTSSLAGLVYGSWFGLDRFQALALWRDPLQGDPTRFLVVGIGFGVLTISLGVILNIVNRLRHRDLLAALMGPFGLAGLVFYWAGLAVLLCRAQRVALPWAMPGILLFPIVAWLLEEPIEKARRRHGGRPSSPGDARLAGRLVEAFETILVYLANTISFVRLAAYGMSHAALLLAILMMARAVTRPGGLAFGLVLAAGNLVAIVLEGIIAAVQALRLEYYEFFGKFFSGAGRPFEPFRLIPVGGQG